LEQIYKKLANVYINNESCTNEGIRKKGCNKQKSLDVKKKITGRETLKPAKALSVDFYFGFWFWTGLLQF